MAGLCFKASVAPFHQWTPDVDQEAPTPVTAFMAVTTKVAALVFFDRLVPCSGSSAREASWAPAVAVLATITILVGNFGVLSGSPH